MDQRRYTGIATTAGLVVASVAATSAAVFVLLTPGVARVPLAAPAPRSVAAVTSPAAPRASTVSLSGATTGSVTFDAAQINCTYTLPSRPWLIEARGTVNGKPVTVSAQSDRGFTQAFFEQGDGPVWTTGTDSAAGTAPGITNDTSGRSVTLDTSLAPIGASGALRIVGALACPAPGSPSTVLLSGAVSGSLQVTSVDCNEAMQQVNSGTGIDVYGTVDGTAYDLALRQDSVTLSGAGPQTWLVASGPSGFDGATGGHFDLTLAQIQDDSPALGSVHIVGTVTCPA